MHDPQSFENESSKERGKKHTKYLPVNLSTLIKNKARAIKIQMLAHIEAGGNCAYFLRTLSATGDEGFPT